MQTFRFLCSFLFFLLCVCPLSVHSQQINNIRFEPKGKFVFIFYDLTGEKGQRFVVNVYCSVDNEKSWGNPLQKVSGDVGEKQVLGLSKKITWDVLSEMEELTGQISFKVEAIMTSGFLTDKRDGKKYKWVRIGSQDWMARNLNTGQRINISKSHSNNGIIEKYCYNDLETNCDIYGGLYQWGEVIQYANVKGMNSICPDGWKIPTESDWSLLYEYLGGFREALKKMKETGTAHWLSSNEQSTNETGFTALPGGLALFHNYKDLKKYMYINQCAYIWEESDTEISNPHGAFFGGDNCGYTGYAKDDFGFSLRCIRE